MTGSLYVLVFLTVFFIVSAKVDQKIGTEYTSAVMLGSSAAWGIYSVICLIEWIF